jgi:hypothetical protein
VVSNKIVVTVKSKTTNEILTVGMGHISQDKQKDDEALVIAKSMTR